MKKVLPCIVVLALLASSMLMTVVPAGAQELVVPGDKDGDMIVSEYELVESLMAYMKGKYLGESVEHLGLGELRAAAHIHVYYPRTITDSANRAVTVYMPITRIITLTSDSTEGVRTLGEVGNIVGVTDMIKGGEGGVYFSELADKPSVGTWKEFDYEEIVKLAKGDADAVIPDLLVICDAYGYYYDAFDVEEKLDPFGIAVAGLPLYQLSTMEEEMEELGYLLEREDEAADYIAWRQAKEKAVRSAVDGLAKPKVYIEKGSSSTGTGELKTYGRGSALDEHCELAGGDNIAKDIDEKYPAVDWAWVISPEQNPDVIMKEEPNTWLGVTDEAETMRQEILTRIPGDIPVIQNGRAYILNRKMDYGLGNVVGLTYWAKILHPSVPLDPEAVYREYLVFQGVAYPEDRMAVYPALLT